jgi:hypothetical protein
MCMRWCVDVVVNAVAIYVVTGGRRRKEEDWWWWAGDGKSRPDVSLPPGIWGVTDHGHGGGGAGGGAGVQAASMRGRTTVGVGVAEEASAVATEKSTKRSIGFFDEYTLNNGQHPPPPSSNRRSRLDDLLSPFSPPLTAKVSPLDPPLDRQMARKAKCVSLQLDPRRPSSSIKMRFSSSFDSLARHTGKGKGREMEEWSGGAVSGAGGATTQGHSALATPFPSVNAHPPPALTTDPPVLPAS